MILRNRINNKAVGMICAFILLIIFVLTPSYTSEGAYDGIQLCLNLAIPSLFPMMFAAIFVIETGLAQIIGNKLSSITKRIFALPGTAGAAVLLAIIGGFPAGAKAVCELYGRGVVGKQDAERMLLFCFSAGPAFLLGTVGGLYGSATIGMLLIAVQIISIITIGFLTRFLPRNDYNSEKAFEGRHNSDRNSKNITQSITSAARKTAAAMLNICLFIVIFSIVRSIIDNCGISAIVVNFLSMLGMDRNKAEAIIPVILEVTSGCVYASDVGIPMTAFAVGFGGLAVHMQILAISQKLNINYPLFLCARLIQGILCAVFSYAALQIIPSEAIDAVSINLKPSISAAPAGAVMLMIMSFMCVLCIPEYDK